VDRRLRAAKFGSRKELHTKGCRVAQTRENLGIGGQAARGACSGRRSLQDCTGLRRLTLGDNFTSFELAARATWACGLLRRCVPKEAMSAMPPERPQRKKISKFPETRWSLIGRAAAIDALIRQKALVRNMETRET
jgi:hypothetical protein